MSADGAGDKALKHRAVAGTFLFRFPNDDTTQRPKVALFRRSAKVRTYQHKYAPISGSVESTDPSPLATALREINEETTLSPPLIRLFRTGKPYSFTDDSIGRVWHINPFGFILSVRATEATDIKLDWEHEGYSWFDIDEIPDDTDDANGESFGVPRLKESLRRVWFDIDLGSIPGGVLTKGLKDLQDDHVSGARQLAGKAVDIFVDVIARLDTSSRDLWWRNVRLTAWHIWKNGRESMGASVLGALVACLSLIDGRLPSPSTSSLPPNFVNDVVSAMHRLSGERNDASKRIAASFTSFLAETFPRKETINILTLSHSSTTQTCLAHALQDTHLPSLDIRVLESRPLFEGVTLARSLADTIAIHNPSSPSQVTIYTDSCAAIAAHNVDLMLLGADLIDRQGRVSNKSGSLPAVLAARHVSPDVRIVALTDRDKVLPYEPPHQQHEDNSPAELVEAWGDPKPSPGKVRVRNVYFEWVPQGLIDRYVTEDGALTTDDIERVAQQGKERADSFFSDL